MSSNECIIPECYIDSCLVEVLLQAGKDHVNHQKGNGTVAREMKNKFSDAFCVGIIDKDRRELDYLEEFGLLKESDFLRLWKHRSKHHYIIQLCPVIEHWMVSICANTSISLANYGLPIESNGLKKITKSVASKNDPRFIALFREMLQKESEPITQLRQWLKYLKENTYQVDINKLKNG